MARDRSRRGKPIEEPIELSDEEPEFHETMRERKAREAREAKEALGAKKASTPSRRAPASQNGKAKKAAAPSLDMMDTDGSEAEEEESPPARSTRSNTRGSSSAAPATPATPASAKKKASAAATPASASKKKTPAKKAPAKKAAATPSKKKTAAERFDENDSSDEEEQKTPEPEQEELTSEEEQVEEEEEEKPKKKRGGRGSSQTPRKRGAKAAAAEDEEAESPSSEEMISLEEITGSNLFNIVKQPSAAIAVAVNSFLDKYREEQVECVQALVNFQLEASGCSSFEISADDVQMEDVSIRTMVEDIKDEWTKEVQSGSGEVSYPLALATATPATAATKQYKKFPVQLGHFWDLLISKAKDSVLTDDFLIDRLTAWFSVLSDSPNRAFRHTATYSMYRIMLALLEVSSETNSEVQLLEKQSSKAKSQAAKEAREKLVALNEMTQRIFDSIMVHRYRDRMPEIRILSMQTLGSCITEHPQQFLDDKYTKYVGWTFSDKSPHVRISALKVLAEIYKNKAWFPNMQLFTQRFRGVLIEILEDVSNEASTMAANILTQLLAHPGAIPEADVQKILKTILADNHGWLRLALSKFAYISIAESGKIALDEQLDNALAFVAEHQAQYPLAADMLVDCLWNSDASESLLQDWPLMLEAVMKQGKSAEKKSRAEAAVSFMKASVLMCFSKLVCAQEHTGAAAKRKKPTDEDRENCSAFFAEHIPQLASRFRGDTVRLSDVITIAKNIDLDAFASGKNKKSFRELIRLLNDVFRLPNAGDDLVRNCAEAWKYCAKTEHTNKTEAEVAVNDLQKFVTTTLVSQADALTNVDDCRDALVRAAHSMRFELITDAASNSEITDAALRLLTAYVEYKQNGEDDEENLHGQLDDICLRSIASIFRSSVVFRLMTIKQKMQAEAEGGGDASAAAAAADEENDEIESFFGDKDKIIETLFDALRAIGNVEESAETKSSLFQALTSIISCIPLTVYDAADVKKRADMTKRSKLTADQSRRLIMFFDRTSKDMDMELASLMHRKDTTDAQLEKLEAKNGNAAEEIEEDEDEDEDEDMGVGRRRGGKAAAKPKPKTKEVRVAELRARTTQLDKSCTEIEEKLRQLISQIGFLFLGQFVPDEYLSRLIVLQNTVHSKNAREVLKVIVADRRKKMLPKSSTWKLDFEALKYAFEENYLANESEESFTTFREIATSCIRAHFAPVDSRHHEIVPLLNACVDYVFEDSDTRYRFLEVVAQYVSKLGSEEAGRVNTKYADHLAGMTEVSQEGDKFEKIYAFSQLLRKVIDGEKVSAPAALQIVATGAPTPRKRKESRQGTQEEIEEDEDSVNIPFLSESQASTSSSRARRNPAKRGRTEAAADVGASSQGSISFENGIRVPAHRAAYAGQESDSDATDIESDEEEVPAPAPVSRRAPHKLAPAAAAPSPAKPAAKSAPKPAQMDEIEESGEEWEQFL